MKSLFPGIYKEGRKIVTKSIAPGVSVYGERRFKRGENEYREWDHYRSKLVAAIIKGMKNIPIKPGSSVLYLGAAQGTTPSHVSDIVGENGMVLCVDIAPKTFEKLLLVCKHRKNMIPILADANKPEDYEEFIEEKVDVIYQDLAQKEQADILVKNVVRYLKPQGHVVFMIKARSIDVTANPDVIFKSEIEVLRKNGLEILEVIKLGPFEKDHVAVVARK